MTYPLIALIAACSGPEPVPFQVPVTDTEPATSDWTLVTSGADSEAATGFLILSKFDPHGSVALVVDGTGQIVWQGEDPGEPYKINRTRLALDGQSILTSAYDRSRIEDIGVITRVGLDGEVLSTTRTTEQHHDFVEHDDETFTWLSWGYADVAIGFDPIPLSADVLRTAAEGSDEADPEQIYAFLDDYPIDPFWSCGHMDYDNFAPDSYEWSHSNSLAHVPGEDAYYVMVRYWDALLKIDRGGALQWQLGGAFGDFEIPEEDIFRHAHMSDVWPGGILVFDNGDHGTAPVSGVAEYAWDEDAMTAEKVWDYRDPQGRFITHLGDARRLPGGNTLIAWGPKAELTEVTPEGEIVWELHTSGTIGRVTWVANFP